MKHLSHLFAIVFSAIFLTSSIIVTDEELKEMGVEPDVIENLKTDKVAGKYGEVQLPACHGKMRIPTGYIFINSERAQKLLVDYWNNPKESINGLVGALVPNKAIFYYQIGLAYVITYEKIGYVSDDDAKDVDYDDLLKEMQSQSDEANKQLLPEQRSDIVGWAVSPKYVQDQHFLVWAKELDFSGSKVLNYDMRILGKDGIVSINAVADMEDLDVIKSSESEFVNCFSYDNGYRYEDFDSSKDKISDWTIGGLIAGSVLAKTGVLGKIGLLLAKFWKLIAVGVAAIGGGLFKKLKRNKE